MSRPRDAIQPTVVQHQQAAARRPQSTPPVRAAVGVSAHTSPDFVDETALVVRRRLKAAALILAVGLSAALARNLFVPGQQWNALRCASLAVLIALYFALRSQRSFSLRQLRWLELVMFGTLTVQVAVIAWANFGYYASQDDASTVVAVKDACYATFSLLILVYGMLIPNPWRRAAAVVFPVACLPYAIVWTAQWGSDSVAKALAEDHLRTHGLMPLIAAFAAVYGTHVINAIRREAFRARQFGQYRLGEKLGSGGMGEVFRAEHLLLKRACAIKLIKESQSTDAVALTRFEREVRSAAQLTHWNSIEIFDFGRTSDGMFYYVMEYLEGKSLDELVKQHGYMPPERVVHFMRQICRALREAHHLGLVHRDLKPANIFAARLGGVDDVAKLLDFGLVRHTAPDPNAAYLTQPGGFSGSPLYMPPEQAVAYHEVDGRGDIYSLGAVGYFLLTARAPFIGRNVIEVLQAHAKQEPAPPSRLAPSLPADLEAVILRMLAKRPEDRYPDADSAEQALAACACADQWTEARATAWWDEVRKEDAAAIALTDAKLHAAADERPASRSV